MNKKFLSGTIFGLSLGLCIGITTPIIGATNNAKDIVIKKRTNNTKAATTSSGSTEKAKTEDNKEMQEAVKILKEINDKLKDNSDDNKLIITNLRVLVNRTDVNPQPEAVNK